MTEHIIDTTDRLLGDAVDLPALFGPRLREEVVRCRDCKEFIDINETCCALQWDNQDRFIYVHPDGFCAWGERRAQ